MSNMTQFSRYAVGTTLLALALGLGVFGIASASRDEADLDTSSHSGAAMDTVYQEECGSCHPAYPPGLLPSASWNAIMSGLDDHFGDNAELPAELNAQITEFLDEYASDRGDRMKNARLLRGAKGGAPLRITELHYFKDEHGEIPRHMVEDNPEVQSFSRCDACHQDTAKGRFDEDTVAIPGFGRWDD